MKNRLITLLTLALAAHSSTAQVTVVQAKGSSPILHYTVDLRDTKQHLVHVTLKTDGFSNRTSSFQMPAWAPGAYSVSHYGRFVTTLVARDAKGHNVDARKVTDDRWEFPANVRELTYDIIDSHRDSTSLYFAMANMDTTLFFANATALFGYFDDDKSAPATISYQKPETWKLICALPPSASGYTQDTNTTFTNTSFFASNYDVLADAPVMASADFYGTSFRQGSAVYDVAVVSDASFGGAKLDSLKENLRRIVAAETDFFHDTPFQHYSFLIYAPTLRHIPSFAQGALEHANSSDYLLINLNWSFFKPSFLNVFSHEFFHLWDVKRIHSSKLGPFDYTQRVMTTSLWMAEGITDYYAHTLLSRYGIQSPEAFYGDIRQWLGALERSSSSGKEKSLEQLSIDESDFHLDNAELFYIKGPLVGLMLDAEIRSRTNNRRSLDDVMRALNADAKQGKTFTDENLIHKVEEYAGIDGKPLDLTDFYNRYIHGTDSLPIERYLALMGLYKKPAIASKATLGYENDRMIFLEIDTAAAIARAGVLPGDTLVAINGTKLSMDNVEELSDLKNDTLTYTITVNRGGKEMTFSVTPADHQHATTRIPAGWLEIDRNETPLQAAIRKGIVGPKA